MTVTRLFAHIALILAAAVTVAAFSAQPAAAEPAVRIAGIEVTPCHDRHGLSFVMLVHGLNCRQAFHQMTKAVSRDRACPKGWKVRRDQRARAGKHVSPKVTLCSKGRRAFTYRLPVG